MGTDQLAQLLPLQEQHKLEMEPSSVWQSMTSIPESPLEQPEDGDFIHIPIHRVAPAVQFATTADLREELPQGLELADSQRLEQAEASVSQIQSLRQAAPAPVSGFVPEPGFMPRPEMATAGAWTLSPRSWGRGIIWPVGGMGPFQPDIDSLRPMGPMPRAPFPVMEGRVSWTQALLQQAYRLPGLEERGPEEYEEFYQEGYQEEMPIDEAAQEEIDMYGALEEETSTEGAPQEEMPTEGVPQDGVHKRRARERISKERAPKYRTPKERAAYHKARKDVSPEDTDTKDEAPDVKVLKKVIYKDRVHKVTERRRKGPPSSVKKLRSAVAIAAAAAAAYAAAANSAAQAAKEAVKAVHDVPASQLATKAALVASSGPLGSLAEFLGAGFGRGATSIPFSEGEMEEFPEEFAAPFNPFTPKPVLSQVLMNAMQATSPEEKKKAVQYSMSHIAQIPTRHDSLKEEFAHLSTTLNQRLNYLGRPGQSGEGSRGFGPPCSLSPWASLTNSALDKH